MRRNNDLVPFLELHRLILCESNTGAFPQGSNPLVFRLLVPEAIGKAVAVGDDSLDSDSRGLQ